MLFLSQQLNNQKIQKKDEQKIIFQKYQNIDNDDILKNNKTELSLPISVFVFDQYYKSIHEYFYNDKYSVDNSIFVINTNEKIFYPQYQEQNYWLNNLKKESKFVYQHNYYLPKFEEKNHPNWIDGGSHKENNLKKMLKLIIKENVQNFEITNKEYIVSNNFFHHPEIKIFSTYFKKDEKTLKNVIDSINYGKLNETTLKWSDIYFDNSIPKINCDEIKKINPNFNYLDNMFDKQSIGENYYNGECDRIKLRQKAISFTNKNGLFTSGYVFYKKTKPNDWNFFHHYYLFGSFSEKPQHVILKTKNSNDNVWYINYDNVFEPEILNPDSKNKDIQIKINLQTSKIKNIDNFLKISKFMQFKMGFLLNGKKKEINFNLPQVLKGEVFSVKSEENEKKYFVNFSLEVKSGDSRINFLSMDGEQKYTFKVDELKINNFPKKFNKIEFFKNEHEKKFYSEIAKLKNVKKYFSLTNGENEKISINDDLFNLMKVNVAGNDLSKEIKITFFNFLTNQEEEIILKNELFLPNILKKQINLNKSSIENIKNIVKEKYFSHLNNYFFENIKIKKIFNDSISGMEKYKIYFSFEDEKINDYWNNQYNEIVILGFEKYNSYIALRNNKEMLNDQKYTNLKLSDLFYITDSGKKMGLSIDDFEYKKTYEDDEKLKIKINMGGWNENLFKLNNKEYEINKTEILKKNKTFDNNELTITEDAFDHKKMNFYGIYFFIGTLIFFSIGILFSEKTKIFNLKKFF